MPERVKVKFDDSDDEQPSQTKKRTAAEAFPPTNQHKAILERHRQPSATKSRKVINFGDRQKGSVVTKSELPASQKPGKLKTRALELLKSRQQLPIWDHADEIRDKLTNNDVLLLVGETGSGKSTQTPQFLLSLCQRTTGNNGVKVGGRVAITQPRRVAAISLAKRVAEEMGTPLGKASPASQVGYSVRFDTNTGPNTQVKFVTDGTLLQELVRDPWLKDYSVIVVDEVHERGANVDLLLGFLKRMIDGRNKKDGRGGVPLKVVVMSATADMESIQSFFGKRNPTVISSVSDEQQQGDAGRSDVTSSNTKITSCYIKGRQYPVNISYVPSPVDSSLDAALERITHIHKHTPLPGDILVFLPGQETITTLESMCIAYAQSLLTKSKEKGAPRLPKLLILPLFAALPTEAQQRVFDATPPFTRKIILATNIAETSVTVPGIRHVIDTGKRKARFFRPGLNLDTLLTKAISRSSANQRAGRAGREAAGNCYRLYTQETFYKLQADTEPEMLRCDLSQLVLILKSHNVGNILDFPLLTPPPEKSFKRALLTLLKLKALAPEDGSITELGRKMSTLPLPANLARILIASQLPQYDCLEEIIDIVSGLSVENIWLPIHNTIATSQHNETPSTNGESREDGNDDIKKNTPTTTAFSQQAGEPYDNGTDDEDDENPIVQARKTLYRREGDHLTLLAAIQSYAAENTDRKDWCRRHGTSHRAMKAAMDVRKQLRAMFLEGKQYKLATTTTTTDTTTEQKKALNGLLLMESKPTQQVATLTTRILKTLLLGLADRVAYLSPHAPQRPTTTTNNSNNNSNSNNSSNNPNTNQDASTAATIWVGPYTTLSSSSSTLFNAPESSGNATGTTNANATGAAGGGGGVIGNTGRRNLQIHPSSVLFSRTGLNRPAWIMFSEFVVTKRAYARCVSVIEGEWLDEI